MSKLRYYTANELERLRSSIPERLDWYYKPVNEPPLPSVGAFRDSLLDEPMLANQLLFDDKNPANTDIDNALCVYKALHKLTAHQASIERVWAYLCHCDCPSYVASRWLGRRPEKEEDAVRKVRNHFFAVGNRALIRDNGISRLWWLGKIAHDIDPVSPQRFLTILLHRQDVRSALIERPSISMNGRLLRAIYAEMQEHWANDRKLFERQSFRSWMVALNRRGGVILLDALPNDELGKLLHEEARLAINC